MPDETPPPPPSSSNTNNPDNTKPNSTQENVTNPNESNTNNNTNNDSLSSRIQSSASNLARNAFFNPVPPPDIAHALPGSSKSTGPAASSSSSSSSASAHYHTEASTPSTSTGRGPGAAGDLGSFRSTINPTTGTRERSYNLPPLTEEAFEAIGSPELHAEYRRQQEEKQRRERMLAEEKGKDRDTSPASFFRPWQSIATPEQQAEELRDGATVVGLLESPFFDPSFTPLSLNQVNAANAHAVNANPDADLIPTDLSDQLPPTHELTPTELQILESFRREYGPSSGSQNPTGRNVNLNSKSLVPDIGDFLDAIPSGQRANDATALRDEVLTGLPGAEDWVSVEERYQDEVWGYLKPALQAAARELEENQQGQGQAHERSKGEDGPAVARLKMILRHMKA